MILTPKTENKTYYEREHQAILLKRQANAQALNLGSGLAANCGPTLPMLHQPLQ
jgi:hypothetical protein